MEEADQLCDEVAIINQGKIIKSDSPINLKRELKADTITVKVNKPESFVQKVKTLDYVHKVFEDDSTIKLMVERGENLVPPLVNFANKNGIVVESIELQHPNLEDVFISYTGTSITEGDKSGRNRRNIHYMAARDEEVCPISLPNINFGGNTPFMASNLRDWFRECHKIWRHPWGLPSLHIPGYHRSDYSLYLYFQRGFGDNRQAVRVFKGDTRCTNRPSIHSFW